MNIKIVGEKFEDFTTDHIGDRCWVHVLGKTPCRAGTDQPIEWRKLENRFFWREIEMIPGDIGIILSKTGLTCVDFDKVLDENGRILPEKTDVQDTIDRLDTWVEVSSSGRGLHAWVITNANTKNMKPGNKLELITDGHVRLTGNSFPSCEHKKIRMVHNDELFKILRLDGGLVAHVKAPFVLPSKILAGKRNITMLGLAGKMRALGASDVEVVAALQALNARCDPPLDNNELMSVASKYPSQVPAATAITGGVKCAVSLPRRKPITPTQLTKLITAAVKIGMSKDDLRECLELTE
jgi:hypothetical protein